MMVYSREKAHGISDDLWEQIIPLLPPESPDIKRGSLCFGKREVMGAILHMLRTEGSLRDIEAESPLYKCLKEWRRTGVFDRMWQVGILSYDELKTLVLLDC